MTSISDFKNMFAHAIDLIPNTWSTKSSPITRWPVCVAKTGLAVCVMIFSLASSAQAMVITLTTANGLGADTFLNGGPENFQGTGVARRDTNFGSENRLVVKFAPQGANNNDLDLDSNFTRISLMRFDLSSISGTITAASLTFGVRVTELNQNGVPADVSVALARLPDGSALDAAPMSGGWQETGITMNNSVLANVFPIQNVGSGANRVLGTDPTTTFSGNSLLNTILADTNNLITFVLLPQLNSPQGIQFFSKENLEGGLFPTLELTVSDIVQPVPLPGAFGLFGIGLIGLSLLRSRRRR